MPVDYRDMTLDDIPAGLRLCRAAGWNQLAADWELLLRLSRGASRVAVLDGRVVGTVTTVSYEDRFAWVGMVLVDPQHRGQGIGTQLLRKALALLPGVPAIRLDATPQGRPVYQRLGFREDGELCRMALDLAAASELQSTLASAPPPALSEFADLCVRPMCADDMAQVVEADRRIFGASRAEILHWALEQSPEYAWIAISPAGVEGYCLGRHGFRFDQIGPIHAALELVAQRLVTACLSSRKPGTQLIVDPFLHSKSWTNWLHDLGFVYQRPFTRMTLGQNRCPGDRGKSWTIFGPELG